jgi:predicted CXXCH cytochrome family protein
MRVVLRRRVQDRSGADRRRYRQTLFDVVRLSIGSGVDQLIQIADPGVAAAHAVLEQRGGALWLRAQGETPVAVNGVPRQRTMLRQGDVLTFGSMRLTVEDLRNDGVVVLRLGLPDKDAAAGAPVPEAQSLKAAGLRTGRVSRLLVLAVLGMTLVAPLLASLNTPLRSWWRATALMPSDALWQPGPLNSAHQFIARNCNACHVAAFTRVTDQACTACHRAVQHHVPGASPARAVFARKACTNCHIEHSQPGQLIDRSSRPCVECHRDLRRLDPGTALQNVADFGSAHPDFSLAMLEPVSSGQAIEWQAHITRSSSQTPPIEHSNLKFSHLVHLARSGIKSPTGNQVLQCKDCHHPDTSGLRMAPIVMEDHCGRCHLLLFDENDPTSAVPHGPLAPVFTSLQEHFSRMFLQTQGVDTRSAVRRRPGDEQAVLTQGEQRRALDWTRRQSLRAARELLETRVCVQCHTVTHRDGARDFDQWQVAPVRLTSSWMPRAQFDHGAHRSSTCVSCHRGAEHSRVSSDVLMPDIRACRACHGGARASGRLASDCAMCHRFHLPGRGPYAASHAAP